MIKMIGAVKDFILTIGQINRYTNNAIFGKSPSFPVNSVAMYTILV